VRHTARGDRNCGENAQNKQLTCALFKRIESALKGTSHKARINRIEISVLGGAFENAHQMRFKSASVLPGGGRSPEEKNNNKKTKTSSCLLYFDPCCHPEKMAGTSNLIRTCNFSSGVLDHVTYVQCAHMPPQRKEFSNKNRRIDGFFSRNCPFTFVALS